MTTDRTTEHAADAAPLQGFDAFEVRIGDLMRGERATLGKSLLDVQRELRIKATYIAAIENGDLGAFQSKGFIAGYVRSYSRYLGFDPEWAFATFCAETGLTSVVGQLSERVKPTGEGGTARTGRAKGAADPFASGRFNPSLPKMSGFPQVNPGALGSILVLFVLLGGLGYGGWTVLQEVQRVRVAPVAEMPGVGDTISPAAGGAVIERDPVLATGSLPAEGLERLYRPQGLDLPVMVARDGPIAALNPDRIGALAPDPEPLRTAEASFGPRGTAPEGPVVPTVTADGPPELALIARTPVWVRVRDPGGSVLFEKTLGPGESYVLPALDGAASLRAGNAGDLYLLVDGTPYGPVGESGAVVSNVSLTVDDVTATYARAELPPGLVPATVAEADPAPTAD